MKLRMSRLFTNTRRDGPKDEVSKNADLLIRGGYVHKEMAGVYSYLPLGLAVLRNIEQIIREEMNDAGGQEIFMPSLHPKENWQKTGRWETMDDLFKVRDASDREYALGPTHEEIVVPLVQQFVSSYKDIPFSVYQFQNKFRMELRAKSGLLRGREFLMKDMYSFHVDDGDFVVFYERMKQAYQKVFERVGIGDITYITYASGGSFSKYSHEYQMLTEVGEDTIYLCEACRVAINKEIIADVAACPSCGAAVLQERHSIEVGNIFELKTRFTEAFGFTVNDATGNAVPVLMGCYGIGLGRLMGAIVEARADEHGIVWPASVAPAKTYIVEIGEGRAGALFERLPRAIYDDRDVSAGIKFADADLLGMPWRVVVSEKTAARGMIEVRTRESGEVCEMSEEEFLSVVA